MSEYHKIFGNEGHARRGRPPLAPEERTRRATLRKVETKRRTEARRRALAVLGHRHAAELEVLFQAEYETLGNDDRFKSPTETTIDTTV